MDESTALELVSQQNRLSQASSKTQDQQELPKTASLSREKSRERIYTGNLKKVRRVVTDRANVRVPHERISLRLKRLRAESSDMQPPIHDRVEKTAQEINLQDDYDLRSAWLTQPNVFSQEPSSKLPQVNNQNILSVRKLLATPAKFNRANRPLSVSPVKRLKSDFKGPSTRTPPLNHVSIQTDFEGIDSQENLNEEFNTSYPKGIRTRFLIPKQEDFSHSRSVNVADGTALHTESKERLLTDVVEADARLSRKSPVIHSAFVPRLKTSYSNIKKLTGAIPLATVNSRSALGRENYQCPSFRNSSKEISALKQTETSEKKRSTKLQEDQCEHSLGSPTNSKRVKVININLLYKRDNFLGLSNISTQEIDNSNSMRNRRINRITSPSFDNPEFQAQSTRIYYTTDRYGCDSIEEEAQNSRIDHRSNQELLTNISEEPQRMSPNPHQTETDEIGIDRVDSINMGRLSLHKKMPSWKLLAKINIKASNSNGMLTQPKSSAAESTNLSSSIAPLNQESDPQAVHASTVSQNKIIVIRRPLEFFGLLPNRKQPQTQTSEKNKKFTFLKKYKNQENFKNNSCEGLKNGGQRISVESGRASLQSKQTESAISMNWVTSIGPWDQERPLTTESIRI